MDNSSFFKIITDGNPATKAKATTIKNYSSYYELRFVLYYIMGSNSFLIITTQIFTVIFIIYYRLELVSIILLLYLLVIVCPGFLFTRFQIFRMKLT